MYILTPSAVYIAPTPTRGCLSHRLLATPASSPPHPYYLSRRSGLYITTVTYLER